MEKEIKDGVKPDYKDVEMPHYRTPMVVRLNKLKEKYNAIDFEFDNGKITDPNTGKSYSAKDVRLGDIFRFEGISDPDDMAVVYVLDTSDGKRGVIVDAFGIYADESIQAFIKEVEEVSGRDDAPRC
ncbi:MAG: hypothetical protein ACK40G_04030 [Cytophagaceae bacterium]